MQEKGTEEKKEKDAAAVFRCGGRDKIRLPELLANGMKLRKGERGHEREDRNNFSCDCSGCSHNRCSFLQNKIMQKKVS